MIYPRYFSIATISAILLAACGAPQNETATPAPSSTSTSGTSTQENTPTANTDENLEIKARLEALPAPYNAADYDKGRRQFGTCRSCHLLDEGAGHRVGPNLYGVFGREVGMAEGFKYSKAVEEADFLWTPEKLDEWLASPRKFLPGNRMSFNGISKPEQRTNLIAYLMIETAPPEITETPAEEDTSLSEE